MRKHGGNCANHKKETNQFSEECGKCVSARLENGETTDPSHWREKPKTNADRIRAMSDEELADWLARTQIANVAEALAVAKIPYEPEDGLKDEVAKYCMKWLKQPAKEGG